MCVDTKNIIRRCLKLILGLLNVVLSTIIILYHRVQSVWSYYALNLTIVTNEMSTNCKYSLKFVVGIAKQHFFSCVWLLKLPICLRFLNQM